MKYLLLLSIIFCSCFDNTSYRAKNMSDGVIKIVDADNGYRPGDVIRIGVNDDNRYLILNKQNADSVLYSDKITYLILDSLKRGDTVVLESIGDTSKFVKYTYQLKNKYIIK